MKSKIHLFARTVMLLLLLSGCADNPLPPITIHLVGDSTMADKPNPDRNPERGWGQMLHLWFNDLVTIRNHAVNGRSSKSFLEEGRWNDVLREINPGDYVFIQFGHNDQKAYDPNRYVNPYSAFRRNLEKMVREATGKGGRPVILSSIVRRNFNDDGTLEDTHGPYPNVARMVARELSVPFIDLQQQTEDLVAGLGPVRSSELYLVLEPGEFAMYPEGRTDNTHLNVPGATEVSRMVAASVLSQGMPLSAYLDPELALPRVLLVTGGHAYDTTEFHDLFQSMAGFHVDSLSRPHALGLLASEYGRSYDVLVFYDFVPELPEKDSAIYTNLTFHGMPMLFLHHALCSYQQWEGYKDMLGGRYVMEGYGSDAGDLSTYSHDLDMDVRVVNREHPVTLGMQDFSIHDEGYDRLEMAEGITPLLETDHPECSSPLAWVNQYDNSTIVYLMLGHDHQAYQNVSFKQLLINSLNWLSE